MEEFIKDLIPIYKSHIRLKQTKKKAIQTFGEFYISFMDQNRNPKEKADKYLQLKRLGLRYIYDNQDLIYSEINK